MRAVLTHLTLTDFRSYERAELALDGRPAFLFGANGAGKTNLLEAVSLLAPGRGLRGAAIAEIGRRLPGEAQGRAWSVAARVEGADGETRLGTGLETAGAARRVVRLEGENAPPGRLADLVRLVWLTPQQDRLFLEGAAERRRVRAEPERLRLREGRERRAQPRVDPLQFRDGRRGALRDARVDLRLVLAEVAHDARVVLRERMGRARHPSVARDAQRLALQSEAGGPERVADGIGFEMQHGVAGGAETVQPSSAAALSW